MKVASLFDALMTQFVFWNEKKVVYPVAGSLANETPVGTYWTKIGRNKFDVQFHENGKVLIKNLGFNLFDLFLQELGMVFPRWRTHNFYGFIDREENHKIFGAGINVSNIYASPKYLSGIYRPATHIRMFLMVWRIGILVGLTAGLVAFFRSCFGDLSQLPITLAMIGVAIALHAFDRFISDDCRNLDSMVKQLAAGEIKLEKYHKG